jgi:hypothetical protein
VLVRGGKYAGLVNSGDIYASATSDNYATGAVGAGIVSFYGDSQLHNTGTIAAVAYSELSSATAVGAFTVIYGGNALLENGGTVTAYASGYFDAHTTGVAARSTLLSATVYNTGSVGAEAYGMHAYAVGAYVTAEESPPRSIPPTAADRRHRRRLRRRGGHMARSSTACSPTSTAEGSIAAAAYADAAIGDARAYGAHVYGNFTGIYNLGDGELVAIAEGSYALAVGAFQDGYFTAFHNDGDIYAHASGETGFAIGAMTLGYYTEHLYNHGDIQAVAEGEGVQSTACSRIRASGTSSCTTPARSMPAPTTSPWRYSCAQARDRISPTTAKSPRPVARTASPSIRRGFHRLHLQRGHHHRRDPHRRRRRLPVQQLLRRRVERDRVFQLRRWRRHHPELGHDQHDRCHHRPGLPQRLRQLLPQLRHAARGRRQRHLHGPRRAGRRHAGALAEPERLLQRRV